MNKHVRYWYGVFCLVFPGIVVAATPGSQCASDYNMSTYYKCECDKRYRQEYDIIVGQCDASEQVWCWDNNGVCAGDSGEGACAVCNCPEYELISDWAYYNAMPFIRRTVIRYNNDENYYVCKAYQTTEYSCYWGLYDSNGRGITSTSTALTCKDCPTSGGTKGTTAPGAKSVTACYIPSGTTGSDDTGSFIYTENCYYTK